MKKSVGCFTLIVMCKRDWGRRGVSCFACIVFLVSRSGWPALPRGVVGLSAVCDCGIS